MWKVNCRVVAVIPQCRFPGLLARSILKLGHLTKTGGKNAHSKFDTTPTRPRAESVAILRAAIFRHAKRLLVVARIEQACLICAFTRSQSAARAGRCGGSESMSEQLEK